jgi:hypothetical protein
LNRRFWFDVCEEGGAAAGIYTHSGSKPHTLPETTHTARKTRPLQIAVSHESSNYDARTGLPTTHHQGFKFIRPHQLTGDIT